MLSTKNIGFADWIKPKNSVIEYIKEIHKMFLKNKRLYVFFKRCSYVFTSEDTNDAVLQIKIAGEFSKLIFPVTVGPIHSRFKFDKNDKFSKIDAHMNKKTNSKFKKDLENRLSIYSMMQILAEFNVLKSY